MSYAAPSDLLVRYDARRIGQHINDDGTTATTAQVQASPVTQAALDDASGLIDSACLAGERYSATDLAGLTGNSQNLLIRLCCDLAYGLIIQRRGYNAADLSNLAPQYQRALDYLQALRGGERIFGTSNDEDAGLPDRDVLSIRVRGQMLSAADRYFGMLAPDFPAEPCGRQR